MPPPEQRPPFPNYLLPSFSFPFRRRQASSSSSSSNQAVPSLSSSPVSSEGSTPVSSPSQHSFARLARHSQEESPSEARLSRVQPNTLKCLKCSTDIALASQIVSKGFTGRHGRAFLVAPPSDALEPGKLMNTAVGRSVSRELLTGPHVVADVSCRICRTVLGWKYVDAKEEPQKYKIGKFILETQRVVCIVKWEDVAGNDDRNEPYPWDENLMEDDDDVIVFDSEDEEECDDLFAGVWDAQTVAKRRAKRVNTRRNLDPGYLV